MNILSRLRKIRACDEATAQVVLEKTIQEAVDDALAERDDCNMSGTAIYASYNLEGRQKYQTMLNIAANKMLNLMKTKSFFRKPKSISELHGRNAYNEYYKQLILSNVWRKKFKGVVAD